MIARLSRRTLLGGFAGSAATAILAACGGGSATSSPATTAAGAATVANQGGNNQAATTIPGAATNPATAGATMRPINGSVGAGSATNGTASSSTSPAGTTGATAAATTGTTAASATAPLGTASTGAITATSVVAKVDPNLAGTLTIYTSQVQADIDMLKAAFNKAYPKITVTVYRDGTEKVLAKLRAEADAKSVQADVLFISDAPTMENLKADKLIQVYKSVNTGPIPREFVEPEGYYTGTKIINTAIAVNTTAKLPPPAAWKDLVKPDYKGKIVTPSPAYSGAAALNYTVFLNTMGYGADFLKGLKANNLDRGDGERRRPEQGDLWRTARRASSRTTRCAWRRRRGRRLTSSTPRMARFRSPNQLRWSRARKTSIPRKRSWTTCCRRTDRRSWCRKITCQSCLLSWGQWACR